MTKKRDQDLLALEQSINALRKSTSRNMLKANLEFLLDYFWRNPSRELPTNLGGNKREGEVVANP